MDDLRNMLVRTLWEMQTTNYGNASAMTLLAFDTLLDFHREYRYIWRRKWTTTTFLYLFCRYYGICVTVVVFLTFSRANLSLETCRASLSFLILGGNIVLTIAVNFISITRLYALYGRSEKLLATLLLLLSLDLAGEYYAGNKLAEDVRNTVWVPPPNLGLTGCISRSTDVLYTVCTWAFVLAYSSILFIFMMVKYVQIVNRLRFVNAQSCGLTFGPLLRAFYTSGTVWFLLLTVSVAFQVFASFKLKGVLRVMAIPWMTIAQTISGCRLILDIRESDCRTLGDNVTTQVNARTGGKVPADEPLAFNHESVWSHASSPQEAVHSVDCRPVTTHSIDPRASV